MRRIVGLVMLAGAVLSTRAEAQTSADTVQAQRAARGGLRNVATVQEIYYSTNMTYTTDLSKLALRPEVVPAGLTITIRHAGTRGWAGEATHTLLPGQSCVMWFGDREAGEPLFTKARKLAAHESPGRALCDFDAPRDER